MTSDMIERAANAIALKVGGKPLSDSEYYTDAHREWYRQAARAAFETLREPTEEMVNAGLATKVRASKTMGDVLEYDNEDGALELVFPAMIDAVLTTAK